MLIIATIDIEKKTKKKTKHRAQGLIETLSGFIGSGTGEGQQQQQQQQAYVAPSVPPPPTVPHAPNPAAPSSGGWITPILRPPPQPPRQQHEIGVSASRTRLPQELEPASSSGGHPHASATVGVGAPAGVVAGVQRGPRSVTVRAPAGTPIRISHTGAVNVGRAGGNSGAGVAVRVDLRDVGAASSTASPTAPARVVTVQPRTGSVPQSAAAQAADVADASPPSALAALARLISFNLTPAARTPPPASSSARESAGGGSDSDGASGSGGEGSGGGVLGLD